MTTMIDPRTLSWEDILPQIYDYISSSNDPAWIDVTKPGTSGAIITELAAGLAAYLSHHAISARRESYKDTAKLYSSIVNISNSLGYSPSRVSSPVLRLSLYIPGSVDVQWSKLNPIAKFDNSYIIPLQDETFIPNQENKVICAIGEWKTWTYDVTGNLGDFRNFLVPVMNIENEPSREFDDIVYNSLEVRVGKTVTPVENWGPDSLLKVIEYLEDSDSNTVLIKTHSEGVILLFGDDTNGKKLNVGDTIVFNYIQTSGYILGSAISLTDRRLQSVYGRISKIEVLSPGADADSNSKIISECSKYNAARRRMVTLEDHKAIAMKYTGIVSASVKRKDDGCCTVQITYLFNNKHILDSDTSDLLYSEEIVLDSDHVVAYDPSKTVFLDSSYIIMTNPPNTGTKIKISSSLITLNSVLPWPISSGSDNWYYAIKRDTTSIQLAYSYSDAMSSSQDTPRFINISATSSTGVEISGAMTVDVMDASETKSFLNYLDKFRPLGEMIEFIDPKEIVLNFKMSVIVDPNRSINSIRSAMYDIIESYTLKLGISFFIGDVVKQWNEVNGVKRIYMIQPLLDKQLDPDHYLFLSRNEFMTSTSINFVLNDSQITTSLSETSADLGYLEII